MEKKYESLKLENQLCFPLYAASRKVVGEYTPHLKKLGITYTQYLVFMVLWENDDLTVGDICRKLYLDNGTLSPVLKKMEGKGFIKRVRSEKDERIVKILLTEEGRQMREKATEIPNLISSCINITKEEAMVLYSALYKILGKEADNDI